MCRLSHWTHTEICMLLFQLICATHCIGSQLLIASLIIGWLVWSGGSSVGWGAGGTVVLGRRAGGAKSVNKKVFLKLFRNNSHRLSLVRLGHRHSINQFNRLQLKNLFSCSLVMYCLHSFRIFI